MKIEADVPSIVSEVLSSIENEWTLERVGEFRTDIENMTDKFKKLSNKFDKYNRLNAELRETCNILIGNNRILRGYIDSVDPKAIGLFLIESQDHIKEVHNRIGVYITKETVATEVLNYTRKSKNKTTIAMNIIKAYGEIDSWWIERENLTLRDWADVFLNYKGGLV